ncbi:MAG: DUF2971 domain-containing protein [Desulfobulbus sp.]|jgi:hypothetical protein|nr:DUF2971 domain-containing protein [Desulfobulbus sp.]
MNEIVHLSRELYADTPHGTLYHYTTFTGLLGIVRSRSLWVSDVRYMNDSAELRHTADLISAEVRERIDSGHPHPQLLSQFADWIAHRITSGHLLFGASFRSHGNLLSQWRGYSLPGKGVSLGFCPEYILDCAAQQQFMVGQCIYEPGRQRALIHQVVDAVVDHAARLTEDRGLTVAERSPLYHTAFEEVEADLLRIAAILKHPSFREEKEWRIVSPVIANQAGAPILFREGHAMLVPYIEFNLSLDGQPPVLDHLYLGPTDNMNISMNSLEMFLAQHGITAKRGIDYCQIPFRQR